MNKIPSLFTRNYDGDRLVIDEVVPGSEWVMNGEGIATRKFDGTACMVKDGKLYKRYDRKKGKPAPKGWEPCEDSPDAHTGHWPGWLPVGGLPEDKWHREAWENEGRDLPDGTYELCGPKIQGNPEGFSKHVLIPHGQEPLPAPRTYAELKVYLGTHDYEGIVWHHIDGRMVKIKKKDFQKHGEG